jgi:outer membrane protein OmpA-like peptidoglycan-associated protein
LIPLLLAAALAQESERVDVEVPDLDVQLFRQSLDAESTIWTNDAGMRPSKYFTVRTGFSYMRDPFLFQFDDEEVVALVRDAFQANVAGTFHFWRMRVGVDLPIYLFTTSDLATGSVGVGDLLLDLKGTILDHHKRGVGVALAARGSFPTSTMQLPLGNRTVGYEVEAIVDGALGPVLLALNVGHRGVGRADFGEDGLWRDALFARFGLGVSQRDNGGASIDIALSTPYDDFFNDRRTPVEGMLGGWARLGDDVVLRTGVGTGFTGAIGSPLVRAMLSLSYEPRWRTFEDDEPVIQYVEVPTEVDEPEVPPGPGGLVVRVTDQDGEPLNAWVEVTHITVPHLVEAPDGPTEFEVVAGSGKTEVPPGQVQVKVTSDGYATAYLEGKVVPDEVLSFSVPLAVQKAVLRDDRIEILEQVFFEYDKADIKAESFDLLTQVATIIDQFPQICRIRIEGHTDSRGDDGYNFALSNDRAESVREFLFQKGIDRSRLSAVGYGEREPLDPRENEEAWALNRRVEFIIESWDAEGVCN